ncbi:glycosyltransferase [Pseudacidovorax sp. NFM-22]|uniref:glycosyltransferase n=1 Tax=Pseudacidovorax sp. NFM-22 TaxID=2744469 RepID=UPI001F2D9774|nr:glycosyltransferase family 2 protein [Pseudacidovorax sp. NFM-22]
MQKVACVIPTYNARSCISLLLASLEIQDAKFDIIVVDSSSTDGTYETLTSTKIIRYLDKIESSDFNHGGTRQRMVEKYPDYDVYIYLTQDAILSEVDSIRRISSYFLDPDIGAVCARQLPHSDASKIAIHARQFNYPPNVVVKDRAAIPAMGIKAAFMSNSFSAYRKSALESVGGFPSNVILGEDMYVAAKMILQGWKIVYAGDVRCFHSHNYTVLEEFKRYFDTGVFHAQEPWILSSFGGPRGEGFRFVRSELKFFGIFRVYLWPNLVFRNFAKILAYKLGRSEKRLPLGIKRRVSMHRRFWK